MARLNTVKLGIVPYLNCFPLVYGLSEVEIYREAPARLAQKAGPGDILLAPIVTAFLEPSWYLIEGLGIGSFGPVDTVRLFMKEHSLTIENLKIIYMDEESITSVALLKVLLKNFYGRSLDSITFSNQREDVDGTLLIGDKVWNHDLPASIDLSQAWTSFTSLPFVYACWMTKSKAIAEEWKEKLLSQTEKNMENLPQLVSKAPKNNCPDVLQYWRRLNYLLGTQHKEGIQRFQKEWASLEGKPVLELKWI